MALLYVVSAVQGVTFSPLVTSSLFWEFGVPDTYFLTFSVLDLLQSRLKHYSDRWVSWSKYPLVYP